ncbi:uncharacterized protein At1g24485-like [Cornus florida]|uniref:uncharacterized protein At1g24485-like n=1 Tax=Cornus florida TaxID=4283 RepID=UPI002897452B|nr:uncharacterized protein At1g24485-like [Cornus florida]
MAVLLLMLSIPKASSYESYSSYNSRIDCGASTQTPATDNSDITWQTDEGLIKTGKNKVLPTSQTHFQMNTLRYFHKGHKNCYTLYFYDAYEKYLFRAGFYYGNYDGLSNPPRFRLEIDGTLWAKVTTSINEEMVYCELLYITKKSQARVCLIRTMDNNVPFISSLEAYKIYDAYNWMDNTTALYLHSGINYGANASVEQNIDFRAEPYNRIWKSKEMSNYLSIQADSIYQIYSFAENMPPWPVIGYAIQAPSLTDSIYLSIDFSPRTAVQAYFVLYFLDPVSRLAQNQTSSVEIYIDNNKMAVTDIPNIDILDEECRVVTLFSVPVNGSANVTISPAEGSTLAPLLNAMEVFSAIDVSEGGHLFNFSLHHFITSTTADTFLTTSEPLAARIQAVVWRSSFQSIPSPPLAQAEADFDGAEKRESGAEEREEERRAESKEEAPFAATPWPRR